MTSGEPVVTPVQEGQADAKPDAPKPSPNAEENMAAAKYSQQLIEQKEREIQQSIFSNIQRIRDVERELAQIELQLKLTAGPKKHALEVIRRKIEAQTVVVQTAKRKYDTAKQVADEAEAALKKEEAVKDKLCEELNTLVQQSVQAQLDKFEQLRSKLDLLNGGAAPPAEAAARVASAPAAVSAPVVPAAAAGPPAAAPGAAAASGADDAAAAQAAAQAAAAEEAKRKAREVEEQRQQAAAARSRHVSINSKARPPPPAGWLSGGGAPEELSPKQQPAAGAAPPVAVQASTRQPRPEPKPVEAHGKFAGFDA